MVWQAANLCQQTSHKSHVNKRQFSAKWHPWWLLLQPKGVERNHRVVDQQLYTYLILKSDQSYNCSPCNGSCWWSEKSFLFSHRYVCHWSYYCTQNLSFYFGEMSLKPACHTGFQKGSKKQRLSSHSQSLSQVVSQPFFTTKSTLNPNSIQICTDK